MAEEMTRFVRTFVNQERDLRELLVAVDGEIDSTLSDHYDGPAVAAGTWEKVWRQPWEIP